METIFTEFVKKLFSSWTALSLAKSNLTGGIDTEAKIDYLQNNLLKHIIKLNDSSDIESVLEDYLDEELNTLCEDESVKQVSDLIFWALLQYKSNDAESIKLKMNKLPNGCDPLSCVVNSLSDNLSNSSNETDDNLSDSTEHMDETL